MQAGLNADLVGCKELYSVASGFCCIYYWPIFSLPLGVHQSIEIHVISLIKQCKNLDYLRAGCEIYLFLSRWILHFGPLEATEQSLLLSNQNFCIIRA
jgi:hypothetical protein